MASLPEPKPTAEEILRAIGELPLSAASIQNERDRVEGWRRALDRERLHFPKEDFTEKAKAIDEAEAAIPRWNPQRRRDGIVPLLGNSDALAEAEVRCAQESATLRPLQKANALGPAEYKRLRELRRTRERTRRAAQNLRDLRAEASVLLPEIFGRQLAAVRQTSAVLASLPVVELPRDVREGAAALAQTVAARLAAMNKAAAEATWAELERLAGGAMPTPTPPTRKRGS